MCSCGTLIDRLQATGNCIAGRRARGACIVQLVREAIFCRPANVDVVSHLLRVCTVACLQAAVIGGFAVRAHVATRPTVGPHPRDLGVPQRKMGLQLLVTPMVVHLDLDWTGRPFSRELCNRINTNRL